MILAFPDFEFWFLAWFALVPLFFGIEREKESLIKSFLIGWVFGTIFFFGSCWWLTHAPITYAAFPPVLAYFLLFCAASAVSFFPGIFGASCSILLRRFGTYAILSVPFLWTAIEFLRFWTTGNNWNAIGYSLAFNFFVNYASFGGVYFISFCIVVVNAIILWLIRFLQKEPGLNFSRLLNPSRLKQHLKSIKWKNGKLTSRQEGLIVFILLLLPITFLILFTIISELTINHSRLKHPFENSSSSNIIAIQPNVPMSGLTEQKWLGLRRKHVELAEAALERIKEQQTTDKEQATTVIFPESPMNFMYDRDEEFQTFVRDFASRNKVNVLFNAAEPDEENNKFFNSAVMVNTEGRKIAQYDKIYLVPFGESVPAPLQNIMPALVGSFSYGKEYDLLPFGEASGGVMICFESHFPNLSREYVLRGADVLIEMTNDGYLGKTPVLRQHLANAVFRAVETNRPVLRVTNVGITAYINERGEVLEPTKSYIEDTRVWTVAKSDGGQTFYVRYGDWFAWLCSIVSLGLIFLAFWKRNTNEK